MTHIVEDHIIALNDKAQSHHRLASTEAMLSPGGAYAHRHRLKADRAAELATALAAMIAVVQCVAAKDPTFAKGSDKRLIADARAALLVGASS